MTLSWMLLAIVAWFVIVFLITRVQARHRRRVYEARRAGRRDAILWRSEGAAARSNVYRLRS